MCPYDIELDDAVDDWSTLSMPETPAAASDPTAFSSLSDSELDELPFGVICLDAAGTILRYNLSEARLARLDRALVLGKNFFHQVAPCTARPEFQGRLEAFMQRATGPAVERFPFVFDFSFGAQVVTIELVKPPEPDRLYLLVNRSQILPPRSKPFRPAPPLAAWEGEAPTGVGRDERGGRVLQLPTTALQSLVRSVQRAGLSVDDVLDGWGLDWGRRVALDLEAWSLEQHGKALRSLSLGEAARLLVLYFAQQGWGTLRFDFGPAPTTGAFVVHVTRSVWQESLRLPAARRHAFTEGYLRAVMSYLADRPLVARVVPPAPEAGPSADLSFLVVAEGRRDALLRLLAAEPITLATVLDELGRTLT